MAKQTQFIRIKATSVDTETNRVINTVQDNVHAAVQPVLKNPLTYGTTLKSVSLVTGSNQINHTLGEKLNGWIITRKRAVADIFDTQDSNAMPDKTLLLTSSANVVVDIFVY